MQNHANMKMQKSDFCPALLAVWALLLFSLRKSSAFDLDADGFPILWQPQTGLLFRPKETYDIADVSDDLGNAFLPDNEPVGRWPKVIAFHAGHDASIAIGVAGRVQCVLELERLFEERYFYLGGGVHSEDADYSQSWLVALTVVLEKCECDSGSCPGRFDYAVLDNFEDHEFGLLKQAVGPLLGSPTWRFTNHHLSHALLGFYASPFRSAMILSYDAGGNDGVLNFYIGIGLDVKLGLRLPVNMGMAYNMISLLLPEVTGAKNSSMICSEDFDINPYTFQETAAAMHELPDLIDVVGRVTQSYPGKFMGYSALAKPHPEVQFWARQYIRNYLQNETAMSEAFSWLRAFSCGGTKNQRILAASAQDEWTTYVEELFGKSLQSATAILGQPLDGIVLTGGCALNVLANQRIYESYTEKLASNPHLPRSFYVPPASNDGGIVIGAIWSVMPPLAPQSLQYLGFPLFDFDSLDEAASSHQARSLTELGGVEYLADLLAGGESWKNENKARARPIIAVVIGRQEVGPRALGHRSLLAVPDVDIKDRMNQLKARQSYRPVAPMIADEALEEVFGEGFVKSPYMTMAPRVKQSVRERFPALAHVDGTARHQSVGAEDEPWIHALLLAVGRKTGLAALINTSFNSKGKPIVNTVRESLKMLDDLPDLDFVLIEDWLFEKGTLHHSSALFQFA